MTQPCARTTQGDAGLELRQHQHQHQHQPQQGMHSLFSSLLFSSLLSSPLLFIYILHHTSKEGFFSNFKFISSSSSCYNLIWYVYQKYTTAIVYASWSITGELSKAKLKRESWGSRGDGRVVPNVKSNLAEVLFPVLL